MIFRPLHVHRRIVPVLTWLMCCLALAHADTNRWMPQIPRTWDDVALTGWATPVAGLNVRPTHISAKEYYSLATENLRTYPVYFPGQEPNGYWDMLQVP